MANEDLLSVINGVLDKMAGENADIYSLKAQRLTLSSLIKSATDCCTKLDTLNYYNFGGVNNSLTSFASNDITYTKFAKAAGLEKPFKLETKIFFDEKGNPDMLLGIGGGVPFYAPYCSEVLEITRKLRRSIVLGRALFGDLINYIQEKNCQMEIKKKLVLELKDLKLD